MRNFHILLRAILLKMVEADLESLFEICNNDNVYRYTPMFLYSDNKKVLNTAINNLGERDFVRNLGDTSNVLFVYSILTEWYNGKNRNRWYLYD